MRINMTRDFQKSLFALARDDQKRVWDTVFKLEKPESQKRESQSLSPGLRWHRVMNGFVSLSVGESLRIIAQQSNQRLLLLYVSQHKPAYNWAKTHKLLSNTSGTGIAFFSVQEAPNEQVEAPTPPTAYGTSLYRHLLSRHVPEPIAAMFSTCTNDDDLLARIDAMTSPWRDTMLPIVVDDYTYRRDSSSPSTITSASETDVPTRTPETNELEPSMTGFTAFDIDLEADDTYLEWVANNPDGFVVNVGRPIQTFLKLHRANCWSIKHQRFRPFVGPSYFKVCSIDKNEVVQWAIQQGGRKPEACKICKP